jgi:hypothetical protein
VRRSETGGAQLLKERALARRRLRSEVSQSSLQLLQIGAFPHAQFLLRAHMSAAGARCCASSKLSLPQQVN